jgi:hypothetical protein
MYDLNRYLKLIFKKVISMKKILSKPMRIVILVVSLLLVIGSAILSTHVETNYDMTEYLPDDSQTKEGLAVLDETFGNHAMVELMIEDVNLTEAYLLKQEIQNIEGIQQVVWLDNQADISNPSLIDPMVLSQYYDDENALMQVIFIEDAYSLDVERAIEQIRIQLADETIYMRGEPISNIEARNIAENEMYKIMIVIVPICFLILLFASRSWIEPIIVLVVLGIGVVINLGTNIILPNVSFITLSLAAALQLAISLDYSLFFIHRFYEFKDMGYNPIESSEKAFKKALPVIGASALTTIIGFVSLLLMQYKIGMDIGLVLSKGIVFSFLTVIFVLPVMMVVMNPLIEKSRHRHFMFHLGGLKKYFIKLRYGLFVLLIILFIGGIYLFQNVDYLYGGNQYASEDSTLALDEIKISNQFGDYDSITLLLKDSTKTQELNLMNELMQNEDVIKIDSLYSVIDPLVPESMIPDSVISVYRQNSYTRMTIYTSITEESQFMYDFNDEVDLLTGNVYDDYYMLGVGPGINEIKSTVIEDSPIVIFVSIVLIALVLLFVFRNIAMVIILIFTIQTAIWFNIGLLSFNDRPVIYIGYLVVFALQLGATIDYAVLFANRYLVARKSKDKNSSLGYALKYATIPMMISGFVLAAAGFTEMFLSDISVVSDIGLLLGRGALLSLAMVLLVLPSLIYIFDSYIFKTHIEKKH